jgi:hypothetical protein
MQSDTNAPAPSSWPSEYARIYRLMAARLRSEAARRRAALTAAR